jgi:hypothetical protein
MKRELLKIIKENALKGKKKKLQIRLVNVDRIMQPNIYKTVCFYILFACMWVFNIEKREAKQ